MRILLITSTASEKSGWGRLSQEIAGSLQRMGAEVVLLADEKKWSFPAFFANCLRARRAAQNCDVVHALDGWPYGVYGLAAVLGTGKRLFINGIGTYSIAPLYAPLRGVLLRRAYAYARKIFCISEYTRKQLESAGVASDRLSVVHLGASSLPAVSPEKVKEFLVSQKIPANSYPLILTVGAIKSRKGQLDTLKAVGMLKQSYPHIFYIAAGAAEQSPYKREMEEYAQSAGLIGNFLPLSGADDTSLSALYSSSTLFALNSTTDEKAHHFEGFGLVILEANMFGKPAVGSRGCGIEDAIKDGKTGYLAAQRDPSDIAEKIQKTLDGYEALSAGAKEFSMQFSWDKTVQAYMDSYTA